MGYPDSGEERLQKEIADLRRARSALEDRNTELERTNTKQATLLRELQAEIDGLKDMAFAVGDRDQPLDVDERNDPRFNAEDLAAIDEILARRRAAAPRVTLQQLCERLAETQRWARKATASAPWRWTEVDVRELLKLLGRSVVEAPPKVVKTPNPEVDGEELDAMRQQIARGNQAMDDLERLHTTAENCAFLFGLEPTGVEGRMFIDSVMVSMLLGYAKIARKVEES